MKHTTPTIQPSELFSRRLPIIVALLAFIVLAQAAFAQGTPPQNEKQSTRQVKRYTIEQFMSTTRTFGSSFSPDEKSILFTSNKSGIMNAYTVPVAGGTAEPRTRSTVESSYAVSYFP